MLMFIKLQHFKEGSGAINTLITRGHERCHNPGLLFTLLTLKSMKKWENNSTSKSGRIETGIEKSTFLLDSGIRTYVSYRQTVQTQ